MSAWRGAKPDLPKLKRCTSSASSRTQIVLPRLRHWFLCQLYRRGIRVRLCEELYDLQLPKDTIHMVFVIVLMIVGEVSRNSNHAEFRYYFANRWLMARRYEFASGKLRGDVNASAA